MAQVLVEPVYACKFEVLVITGLETFDKPVYEPVGCGEHVGFVVEIEHTPVDFSPLLQPFDGCEHGKHDFMSETGIADFLFLFVDALIQRIQGFAFFEKTSEIPFPVFFPGAFISGARCEICTSTVAEVKEQIAVVEPFGSPVGKGVGNVWHKIVFCPRQTVGSALIYQREIAYLIDRVWHLLHLCFLTFCHDIGDAVHRLMIHRVGAACHIQEAFGAGVPRDRRFLEYPVLLESIDVVYQTGVIAVLYAVLCLALALGLKLEFHGHSVGFGFLAGLFQARAGNASVKEIVGLEISYVETVVAPFIFVRIFTEIRYPVRDIVAAIYVVVHNGHDLAVCVERLFGPIEACKVDVVVVCFVEALYKLFHRPQSGIFAVLGAVHIQMHGAVDAPVALCLNRACDAEHNLVAQARFSDFFFINAYYAVESVEAATLGELAIHEPFKICAGGASLAVSVAEGHIGLAAVELQK